MRVPRELLRTPIEVEDYDGGGALGPVFAAEPRTIRASVQPTQRLLNDGMGRTVTADQLVIIRPEDGPIHVESKVTIDGAKYRVAQMYPQPDSRRPSHYELLLIRWAP